MAVTQNGPKQKNRHLTLETPLGTDVLVLRRLDGYEKLSMPFRLELDAISTDPAITHKDILGQNVTVTMDLADDKKRYFNGFVSRFELHGYDGQFAHYRAVVVPWLWFLTRTTDCRIFQDKSIPDIIQGIFREHGFTDCEDALSGSYEAFEYVTQYRETDFDFVSRLMEQEGICYFFRHEEHKHTLVLADSYDAHQACPGYEIIPFYPPDSQKAVKEDYVWDWQTRQAVRPGTFALNDYDFTAPKKKLRTAANITRDYEYADYEMYDYPGGYTDKGVGNQYSQARIEERQSDFDTCQGQGNVRGLLAGGLTSLTKHPGEAHNREYLLTAVTHHVESDSMETGRNEAQDRFYSCEFDLIDAKTQFRPPLATPKGIVRGPQTAVVVGKSGETVWTDKYGRVKVQFHWDREGQNNEKSSCWVRVSQLWAGKNWGGMHIPHIGQEVIVDFLEGDPDRPIITGRVYNADNMPPLDLPEHKYFSVIRDDYGNEMVMDGRPGQEHVALYSPNKKTKVLVGRSFEQVSESDNLQKTYGNSLKFIVGNVISGTMGSKLYWTIGNAASVLAGANESVTVGTDISVFMGAKGSVTVAPEFSLSLGSKFSAGFTREFSYTKWGRQRTAGGDIVYDSKKKVVLSGGPTGTTIIQSSDDEAFMASGTPGPPGPNELLSKGFALAAAASSVAGSITSIASMQANLALLKSQSKTYVDAKTHKEEEHVIDAWESTTGPLVGGLAGQGVGLLATIGFLIGHIATRKNDPVPKHLPGTVNANVSVKNQFVHVFAGVAPASSEIKLKPRSMEISTSGDMQIKATNFVNVNSGMAIFRTASKTTDFKGMLKHKNWTVLP